MSETVGKTTPMMRIGILLAILTLILSFSLGVGFGGFEHEIRGGIKANAEAVLSTKYNDNAEAMNRALQGSWTYLKRSHYHSAGLGAISLIAIFSLIPFGPATVLKGISSILLGTGSLGYSLFWLLAGIRGPVIGGMRQAKESLSFLARTSSVMCLAGLILVFIVFIQMTLLKKRA